MAIKKMTYISSTYVELTVKKYFTAHFMPKNADLIFCLNFAVAK